MGKGSSGKKQNNAARRKRAIYKLEDRRTKNKKRKAHKEEAKQQKLKVKGKGIYAIKTGEKDGGKSGTTE